MEAIFSPTRSMTTEMTENTPVENTKRTLFKETEKDTRAMATPLATITNIQTNKQPEDEALSPSLQNVSQLKNWITTMEKKNKEKLDTAWKRPASINKVTRTRQTSSKVHELRDKIVERKRIPKSSSSAVSTPLPDSKNVKIPMNKVQQMKQILLDYKNNQSKQSELIHMSSKKRAQIAERLNKVKDIQKWLNEMEQQNRKIAIRNDASVPKTKELNLPMNRVREMKNWLIEFERQNKEHCNRFGRKSNYSEAHQYGEYIPMTRSLRRDSIQSKSSSRNDQIGAHGEKHIETPSKIAVSELAQFLVDFERKNKEHYEKSQRKSRPDVRSSYEQQYNYDKEEYEENFEEEHEQDESMFDAFQDQDQEEGSEAQAEEDSAFEETYDEENQNSNEDESTEVESPINEFVVLNTSMLDREDNKNDMNTSMIPTMNVLEQSQWNDDYDDLMKVDIDIEPVQSAESWENESFGYSNDSVNEEEEQGEISNEYEEEKDELSAAMLDEESSNDSASTDKGEHTAQLNSVQSSTRSSLETSEEDELIENEERLDGHDLLGEEILSTSYTGARFSSSFMISNDTSHVKNDEPTNNEVQQAETLSDFNALVKVQEEEVVHVKPSKKGNKRFSCAYKSLFRVFVPKKKSFEQRISDETEGEENVEPTYSNTMSNNAFLVRNGDHLDPDCHQDGALPFDDFQPSYAEGYLPNTYSDRSNGEPQDFAREMLLSRASNQYDPTCESPVSLASAFRRSMSPTSSSCAGSELSGLHALIEGCYTQHVGWLQGHFHSPKAAVEMKRTDCFY